MLPIPTVHPYSHSLPSSVKGSSTLVDLLLSGRYQEENNNKTKQNNYRIQVDTSGHYSDFPFTQTLFPLKTVHLKFKPIDLMTTGDYPSVKTSGNQNFLLDGLYNTFYAKEVSFMKDDFGKVSSSKNYTSYLLVV